MGLTTNSVVYAQDFRDISSTKQMPLGTKGETRDGRLYRYALAGAVNLAAGKITIAEASAANHTNRLLTTAAALGATKVSVPLGATAAAADLYADGQLVVNDNTGEGTSYLIASHAAASSSGTLVANLIDPIKVALDTTTEVSLIRNRFAGIVVSANSVAAQAVGVPNVPITAAFYGWVQTGGECSVLSDGIIGKGSGAIISDAVNGAVEVEVAGTVTQRVGYAPEATVDTEYRAIVLTLE